MESTSKMAAYCVIDAHLLKTHRHGAPRGHVRGGGGGPPPPTEQEPAAAPAPEPEMTPADVQLPYGGDILEEVEAFGNEAVFVLMQAQPLPYASDISVVILTAISACSKDVINDLLTKPIQLASKKRDHTAMVRILLLARRGKPHAKPR
jgi:hypothetical protein